jgi:hypothetical protein
VNRIVDVFTPFHSAIAFFTSVTACALVRAPSAPRSRFSVIAPPFGKTIGWWLTRPNGPPARAGSTAASASAPAIAIERSAWRTFTGRPSRARRS